ncbi:MAG TPA: tetratricopeptide repeat protein [Thermoanaerobaculia bacterium]|jgi:Flp pilus assembly protein TadD|nr:tetratricopeptide repeat protein [Thermoanaerobaculia bacterium]
MKRKLILPPFLALALLALPLPAQTTRPAPLSPQAEKTMQSALQKAQTGDLQGAIALLEPLNKPGANPSTLSLLGTLYLDAGRPKEALALLGPLADTDGAGPLILHNAARAAFALNQTERAEKYLERATAKAPGSPAARALGLLLGSQGRLEESYLALRPWALAHAEDTEARVLAAYDAVELDRVPEAAELLQGMPDDNPRTRLLHGRLQLLQQRPREGIHLIEPLLQNGPPELNLSVRRYLAEGHLALGESNAAIELLKGKVGDDPSLAVLLGRAYYRGGDPAAAITVLEPFARNLLAGDPTAAAERSLRADLALEYGQALVASSRWTDAVAALSRATQLDPGRLQAWQLLGRAQLAAGRRDDANRSMDKVRQVEAAQKSNVARLNESQSDTDDPTGRNLREAAALADAGRIDEALARIRKEVQLQPGDPRPRLAEARTLLGAKRSQEALKAAADAVTAQPGNPDFLHLRGAAKMSLRDLAGAEQDFRQTLRIKPDQLAAMSDLAVLLIANGKKDEARQLLRRVLELKPDDAVAKANLAKLEAPK